VSSLPEPASEFMLGEALARVIHGDVEPNRPTQTTRPPPRPPENIVSALEKARDDKALITEGGKHVGHLRRDDFTTLRDWCRVMRLGSDAAVVEAAVTAAG
jgi:hypothetical protein